MAGKLKVVGIFRKGGCTVFVDGCYIAWFSDLKYSGEGTESDNMRLYLNDMANVWLDYAIYE